MVKAVESLAHRFLGSLVNVSPVANVMQIDSALLHIEFIKDPVISHSQPELRTAFQSFVWKT
jgi:hypothetical protein